MLIIALVLAVIGLAALVFAVITSNELVAWVCIGASVLGVVLLIFDALQERKRRDAQAVDKELDEAAAESRSRDDGPAYADYPEDDESSAPAVTGADTNAISEYDHGDGASDEHNTH
jgi:hypothetical protein